MHQVWECLASSLLIALHCAQGVVLPLTVMTAISTLTSPLLNYALITMLGLGLRGAAYAYLAEELLLTAVATLMVAWLHRQQAAGEKTWRGLSSEALRGWGFYLRVSRRRQTMGGASWHLLTHESVGIV